MSEKFPTNENSVEKILNEREVLNVLEEIVGSDYEIFRSLENEEGLYILEVRTRDENGEFVQYNYRRNDNAGDTVIDVIFFDGEMPVGGHLIKKYKEGVWVPEVD